MLTYKITTEKSNSGSPILIKRNGSMYVVAIHKGVDQNRENNWGRMITTDVALNIVVWEK
jgi:V8-like Glu-specific endopeptidase